MHTSDRNDWRAGHGDYKRHQDAGETHKFGRAAGGSVILIIIKAVFSAVAIGLLAFVLDWLFQ